jgi:hypothetical protein
VVGFSEILVPIQQITEHHIPDDCNLHFYAQEPESAHLWGCVMIPKWLSSNRRCKQGGTDNLGEQKVVTTV